MMKHLLRQYIVWFGCILLLNSACSRESDTTTTALPSATAVQPTTIAAIETTAPIATLTPSAAPTTPPVVQTGDTVDALASQTVEGYYQIGSTSAPITMVDYSDFF